MPACPLITALIALTTQAGFSSVQVVGRPFPERNSLTPTTAQQHARRIPKHQPATRPLRSQKKKEKKKKEGGAGEA